MDRRRVVGVAGAVRNGIRAPGDDERLAVALQGIAEDAEERDRPVVAGERGGGRIVGRQIGEVRLKERPLRARRLPGGRNTVGEVARPLHAEIFGTLPVHRAGGNRVQDVGGQQPALGDDGFHIL
jgi:hypothetical protein